MELVYAFLALNADRSADGKLHVFGGDFDTMQVSALPGLVPPFSAVVKMRVRPDEFMMPHTFKLDISRPDGVRRESPVTHPLPVTQNARNPEADSYSLVIAAIQTAFEIPGEYTFHIVVDEHDVAHLPLFVSVAQPAN